MDLMAKIQSLQEDIRNLQNSSSCDTESMIYEQKARRELQALMKNLKVAI